MIINRLRYHGSIRSLAFKHNIFTITFNRVQSQERGYASTMPDPYPSDVQLTSCWTSKLNPCTVLSMISIPGTHSSGTYSSVRPDQSALESQTQSWSILEQLQAGIRFLDLKVKFSGQKLVTCYGGVLYEDLETILNELKWFLSVNNKQFVIVSFQGVELAESVEGGDPSKQILDLFRRYGIEYQFSKQIPNIQQIKGKVWLWSGKQINFQGQTFHYLAEVGLHDKPEYYLQNYSQISHQFGLDRKVQESKRTAFDIPNDQSRMKINNLSATGSKLQFFDLLPYKIALDEGGPNCHILRLLQNRRAAMMGVTVMDFPGNRLIQKIIRQNFEE